MPVQLENNALHEALRTVAVNGAYKASRALSKWLRRGVRLTSNGFQSVPISEVSAGIGADEDVIAAIHMPLTNDLTGHFLLSFPERTACGLADILLQQPDGTSTQITEVEQSCIQETANIVGSAYANSLSKWLKLHIEPGVPTFAHDMVCAVVDPLLADTAEYHDEAFVANTAFLMDGRHFEWNMLLLPSQASLSLMMDHCQSDVVRSNALKTIAINGAFDASRAVSKWLKTGVRITTEGFLRVALDEVGGQFDENEPVVGLHFPLSEHLQGHSLLLLSRKDALRLIDLVMGQEMGTTTEIGPMEQSALEETGNIIASSFVNSWSNWLDVHIEPAAPQFVLDLPGAIIESVLSEQARFSDEALIARTDFTVNDQWLEWVFMLLPAPSSMRLIESSC